VSTGAVTDERVRVAIVGAGFGGLALGIGLLDDGVNDFVILERGDGVGGTWRYNTYPGAACDVPSHLYSYSFAPNPDWSRAYAQQPEILDYLERCTTEAGLRDHLRTSWQVTAATWDELELHWTLHNSAGDMLIADVVVFATGTFGEPRIPVLDGLDSFAGDTLHSAQWDHSVDLAGCHVGVIGTGASGVQIIPEVAKVAGRTTVFQRTAPFVLPRHDPPFSDEERTAFRNDPEVLARTRQELYERFEGATLFIAGDPVAEIVTKLALEHLDQAVPDRSLRNKLTPRHALGCNRTLISSDFYRALQQPDVELVVEPIARVVESGIVTADGVTHPLDVVIFATGYTAGQYLHGIDIRGTDGTALAAFWGDAPRAYLGMTVSGFPNMFVFYGPNTNQGGNSIILILEAQATYVRDALATMTREAIDAIDVRLDVLDSYDRETQAAMAATVWVTGCNSYFTNDDGRVVTQLPHTSGWYAARTASADLEDFVAHRRGVGYRRAPA
jgi:cation diffusion facilitator CzcD-associated flavoprotein CzcO